MRLPFLDMETLFQSTEMTELLFQYSSYKPKLDLPLWYFPWTTHRPWFAEKVVGERPLDSVFTISVIKLRNNSSATPCMFSFSANMSWHDPIEMQSLIQIHWQSSVGVKTPDQIRCSERELQHLKLRNLLVEGHRQFIYENFWIV